MLTFRNAVVFHAAIVEGDRHRLLQHAVHASITDTLARRHGERAAFDHLPRFPDVEPTPIAGKHRELNESLLDAYLLAAAGIDQIDPQTYRQLLLHFLYRLAGAWLVQSAHVPQDRPETLANRLALRGWQGREVDRGRQRRIRFTVVGKCAQQRQLGELVRNP
ncbi:MAG: hypothetical protein F4Y41_04180, partial [Gammaproteobacteria bacterium]|nr:hypothetical protein [Gammaproteobacteria bacterium]